MELQMDMGEPTGTRQRARKGRLLIVDDEPQIGNTLRLLLHRTTRSFRHEREGLALIKTDGPFDIIFCDLMPVISGTASASGLEAMAPH
jgi:CheY-like chemotaxis protein